MGNQANPVLLQKGDPSRTPLFLIHDVSGAIFNYYKLESLDRPVYGIYSPWLQSKEKWEGDLSVVINKCIELIKSVVPRGEILAGGNLQSRPFQNRETYN